MAKALSREAKDANLPVEIHIVKKLERITPPIDTINIRKIKNGLPKLINFLSRVPAVNIISSDVTSDAYWWVKLDIDVSNALAWRVVQELGYVLNYLSLTEGLPTVFKPVSPPPYLNGGVEYLSWVIESTYNYIDPKSIAKTLEGRLPRPVTDLSAWDMDE
ncbi:MAG: hypothetical protein AAFR74_08285 [Pseudomonadota bacterium]